MVGIDKNGRIVSRRQFIAGSSAALVTGLSGCTGGDDGSDGDGSGGDGSDGDGATTGTPGEETGILDVVTHLDSPAEQEALQAHAEDFEADTGWGVNIIPAGPDELIQLTSRRIRAGDPPALVATALSNAGHLVIDDQLVDLSDEREVIESKHGEIADRFWPQHQGNVLAVPVGLNGHNLSIRQDMVEQAGFSFPETNQERLAYSWQTHAEWVSGINDELGVSGMGLASGSTSKATNDAIALLWNHGVDIWTGENPSEIELTMHRGQNRERSLDMLENVNSLLENGAVTQAGWSWGELLTQWSQEAIASQIYSIGRVLQITRDQLPEKRFDVQPVAAPSYQGRARSDGAQMPGSVLVAPAVVKDSGKEDIARQWITHFVDHPASIDVCTAAAFHAWPAFPERRQSDRYLNHPVVSERDDVREYQEEQMDKVQLRMLTAQGSFNPWVLPAWTQGILGNLIARMEVEDMSPEESLDATAQELMDAKPDSIN